MRRKWTVEEEQYLQDSVGKVKIETIATNLNRSLLSVEMKRKRMGLYNTKQHVGILTMGELARIIKVERNTVKLWAKHYGLPFTERKVKGTKTFYFVDTDDFWSWAYRHQHKVDFSKIEKHALPPEPDWVSRLRSVVRETNYRPWTTDEERLLVREAEYKSISTIAKQLNRSRISVERKYNRLKNNGNQAEH